MSILISFCNLADRAQPPLGLLDLGSCSLSFPSLPEELQGSTGITGLAASPDAIYAVVQKPASVPADGPPDECALAILAPDTLSLLGFHLFELGRDVHSIAVTGDRLFAVSTGTDEVLELRLAGARVSSESIIWRPRLDAPRVDINHLNGICHHHGELLVAGFGERAGERWSSATNGFVTNTARREAVASGIRHPHSVVVNDAGMAYCESAKAAVDLGRAGQVGNLPGYTRGLCVVGDRWLVATSVGRHPEEGGSGIANAADPGPAAGMCGVFSVSSTLQVERVLDLGPHAREVYDLLPLDD